MSTLRALIFHQHGLLQGKRPVGVVIKKNRPWKGAVFGYLVITILSMKSKSKTSSLCKKRNLESGIFSLESGKSDRPGLQFSLIIQVLLC